MYSTTNHPYTIHKILLSNGAHLAYIDEGTGPQTLLFIHGLATYGLSWKKNIEELKQHYRCIAIDLPGNGFSDRGDFSYSMHFFAHTIEDFIHKAQLGKVHLVGHSMGGQVAMTLAINNPSLVHKMMLCAPAGFEVFNNFEKAIYHNSMQFIDMFSTEENSLRKTIRNSFYLFPTQADDMIAELVDIMKLYPNKEYRHMIEACISSMLNEPVLPRLHEIQVPVLVMFGERDALIPNKLIHPVTTRSIAEAAVKKMPHATLEMLPQCGHFLQWEKAKEVNTFIHHFIS